MKIKALGIGESWWNSKDALTGLLVSVLNDGAEAGYVTECLNWLTSKAEELKDADGYIFFKIQAPERLARKPHVLIYDGDSQDVLIDKIQSLIDQMESYQAESDECPFFGDQDPYKENLKDLGSDVTVGELKGLNIKSMIVEINNKPVTLSKEDIVTLVKINNLMQEYGYKIKEVIV